MTTLFEAEWEELPPEMQRRWAIYVSLIFALGALTGALIGASIAGLAWWLS